MTTTTSGGCDTNALWKRAQACLVRGQIDGAHAVLAEFEAHGVALTVHAHLVAAQLAWNENRIRAGTAAALAAAHAPCDDPGTLCTVVSVLLVTGEIVAARKLLEHPALAACDDPLVLMRLAAHRKRLEEHPDALALLDRARAQGHDSPALAYQRGEELMFNGRLDEAETEMADALARAPAHGHVALPLVRLRRQLPLRNHLESLERSLGAVKPGGPNHAALEFARYKTLEDLGRDEEAWTALAHGNALMYARLCDAALRRGANLDRFVDQCTPGIERSRPSPVDGPQPIFIIGMPRSGSTLLERMLGNHSGVTAAGELPDMGSQLHWAADSRDPQSDALLARLPELDFAEVGRRYLAQTQWRAHGRPYFVDKHSPNWVLAGVIHAALPGAPILNLVRDPMDVCFSNWRVFFGDASPWSYDQSTLARYYLDYRRVVEHWHALMPATILDVPYASLVNEPDATMRRVFAFCGLEWEPGCTDITRNSAPTSTLSTAQVRSPVRRDTGGRWRHYAQGLTGLADALSRAGSAKPT